MLKRVFQEIQNYLKDINPKHQNKQEKIKAVEKPDCDLAFELERWAKAKRKRREKQALDKILESAKKVLECQDIVEQTTPAALPCEMGEVLINPSDEISVEIPSNSIEPQDLARSVDEIFEDAKSKWLKEKMDLKARKEEDIKRLRMEDKQRRIDFHKRIGLTSSQYR